MYDVEILNLNKNNVCANMSVLYENFSQIYIFVIEKIFELISYYRNQLNKIITLTYSELKEHVKGFSKLIIPSLLPSAADFDHINYDNSVIIE